MRLASIYFLTSINCCASLPLKSSGDIVLKGGNEKEQKGWTKEDYTLCRIRFLPVLKAHDVQ